MRERLKGGVGGAGRRIRERIRIEKPSDEAVAKHAVFYSDRDLHLGNIELIPTPERLFGNTNPIHFDLGCGRGEYMISLAEQYPDRNFVGIDSHLMSLYFGINAALNKKLSNIKFIRADVRNLFPYIPDETVQVCSILFPAPIAKKRSKRELIREPLVRQVCRVLSDQDIFIFVSDAQEYFDEKIAMIKKLQIFKLNLISSSIEDPVTRYQRLWQSKGIPSNRAEFIK